MALNKIFSALKIGGGCNQNGLQNLLVQSLYFPSYTLECSKKTVAHLMNIPEPPKRPINPYLRFANETRLKYSHMKVIEMGSQLGKDWAALSSDQKARYQKEYNVEWNIYRTNQEKYLESLTPAQIDQLSELKGRKKPEFGRLLKQERKKLLMQEAVASGKPKKAMNTFILYTQYLRQEAPELGRPGQNWLITASENWKLLSQKEKDKYQEKAQKLKEKYVKDLAAWEARMVSEGKEDFVHRVKNASNIRIH